jgi:alkyl hydroperoxide reductase subunit AhpC
MALHLGDTVPNFTQASTHGEINFYEWAGDSWVVLFPTLLITHLFVPQN